MSTFSYKDVIRQEQEQLRLRRQKLGQEHGTPEQENWFGIALSGGGIRSAIINLGFLRTLNKFGILQRADYLSSVSGGGYTHAFVQETAKEKKDFNQLFTADQITALRQNGEYLIPGQGFWKRANLLLLMVAFLVSWLMSLISPILVAGIIYYLFQLVVSFTHNPIHGTDTLALFWGSWAVYIAGALLIAHFLVNIILNFNLNVSKQFNRVEMSLAVVGIFLYVWVVLSSIPLTENLTNHTRLDYLINAGLLFLLGFFTNPNSLSFHRFYRKQLADLFLRFVGEHRNVPLKDVFNANSDEKKDFLAPYPLINTCLNLQNPGGGDKFKGSKASDYFLLSPLFCGSKLTCYVPTDRYRDYRHMTLPAAVTISAAAMNPGMGVYSNKMLSILMTIFNARLGFWISNPIVMEKAWAVVWWPIYFFKELLGRIGLSNKMINISDGGHIENLGVYELLRRNCRLIVAVDAGEDKLYGFADLNNLIIRARNELGLEIRFRDDQQPEDLIRPRPSQVYSRQRYAIADIWKCWEDDKVIDPVTQVESVKITNFETPFKVGTFIYVKSSVMAPTGKPYLSETDDYLKYGTYKYKIYHPDFPHEPTSDQFFDDIQWESYYQLGQYLGADVLGVNDLEQYDTRPGEQLSVDQLLDWFDERQNLFEPPIVTQQRGPQLVRETTSESAEREAVAAPPEVKYKM